LSKKKDPTQDFRNVLFMVWKHLNLPDPTPLQYDIATFLDKGPKRAVIQAFRGVGKSWITSAFVLHTLRQNPDTNILVVSASKTRADDFTTFTKRLIEEMPLFQHLKPKEGQRDSKIAFDVGPAKASHAPSVKSVGITGQLTGSRADLIVLDDVEVPNNSETQMMRDKLAEAIKEADAILKPDGRVVFLGTPQCEDSIYRLLEDRGYQTRIWPAEYPSAAMLEQYGRRLAPMLADTWDQGRVGEPTEPTRFSLMDLAERRLSYGNSGYALQFMLNTSLSDQERYPLKLSDLVVMDFDNEHGPEKVFWSGSPENVLSDLPNVGLRGDRYHRPFRVQGDYVKWQGVVMTIDPSGRGEDETGYAVVASLNGWMYVLDCGGLRGGYTPENLRRLAEIARKNKANEVLVEANFGDGMFNNLLLPYLRDTYPVTLTEVKHSQQKEKRIADVLEPVMNQHRLVVPPRLVREDYDSVQGVASEKQASYRLMYQMTRLTRDRGSLRHDDRLDALSMAVQYWKDHASADVEANIKERKERLLEKELEDFERSWNKLYRPKHAQGWISHSRR
jgi:hypothetical protein